MNPIRILPWLRLSVLAAPFVVLACGENLLDSRYNANAGDANAADANDAADGNTAANTNTASNGNKSTPVASPNASACTPPATPITYTNTTKALINQYCQNCHDKKKPIMNTFAASQTAFRDGGGQDLVQNGGMPLGTTLSKAIKCQFEQWGDNNYAN